VEGRRIQEVVGDKEYVAILPRLRRVLSGETVSYERLAQIEENEPWRGRTLLLPQVDGRGRVVGFFTLVEDITEWRQTQAALGDSRRMLLALIEAMPVAVFVLRADGTPHYANQQARAILGRGVEAQVPLERLAEAYDIYVAGTDQHYPVERMPIVRALAGERATVDDAVIVREGRRIPTEVWASPVLDADGRPEYAIAAFVDIAERRRAEEVVRRSERLASIGTLAAGIAHEINNSIQSVLMAAEYALRDTQRPDAHATMEKALGDIVENARRCGQIVRSVLQFARESQLETWPNDLTEVVKCAMDWMRRDARWHRLRVETRLADEPLMVQVNPVQMEHVLVNVMKNAIASGAPCSRVVVSTRRMPRFARVRIEDDGPGMRQEDRRRAFDPFFTTRRERGGTGLGLSLAHGIVSQHAGKIQIESAAGRGTSVCIDLPFPREAPQG
jgi:signal transduction histidine kinase